ncbi:collagen alpha-1(I) chain-like [Cebus imitator]|uniref:collagen alpha-1(I) chain-like n=1 Tax=Cebus imitator TaxID=2715852 RepID=UPI0018983452|nr:collagen alpha-1(I) chain-like [Cebus imitator]
MVTLMENRCVAELFERDFLKSVYAFRASLGRGRRRRRRRRRRLLLHPSRAGGCRGRPGTRHTAGNSVRLLRTAGVRVLAHGCCQHHAGRDQPGIAARELTGGAVPGHGRSPAGVPVPSPLVLPGGAGRRREGRGGGSPGGTASSSSRSSLSWPATRGRGSGGVSRPVGAAWRPGAAGRLGGPGSSARQPRAQQAGRERGVRHPPLCTLLHGAAHRGRKGTHAARGLPPRSRSTREHRGLQLSPGMVRAASRTYCPSPADRARPGCLCAPPVHSALGLEPGQRHSRLRDPTPRGRKPGLAPRLDLNCNSGLR